MKSVKCASCGFVGWADAELCKKCGASMAPAPGVAAQPVPNYPVPQPNYSVPPPPVAFAAPPAPDYPVPPSNYSVMPPAELKTGLAITAMVLGIVNFTCSSIFVIPLIVGIVISAVALNKIKNYPHEYGGKPMAVTGLVMNIVAAVIMIPIVLAIAVPNFMAARMAANEGSAMQSMRTISSAQQTYQGTAGRGDFGSLTDLEKVNLITAELAIGVKNGYQFRVVVITATREHPAGFTAVAVPNEYGSSGRHSFFIDETGVLRGEDSHGLDASRSSPEVGSYRYYEDRRPDTRRSTSYTNDE